ncbi:class I SAM-dependent methyltransferase [Methylobacterium sp. HMF5984]|uniref:class I SAM-dependent methyltransferase n=1 Tax=Methylobacterium sp. HMF5984 TaxID=3367370 RepID=UPI0038524261
MDADNRVKVAEGHWDALPAWRSQMPPRARWNESFQIVRDQNFRICGKYLDGENTGLVDLFKQVAGAHLPLAKAISVGCGTGAKEMRLIQAGVVSHFHLCDLSSVSLEQGKQIAQEWGLSDKVSFAHGNAFDNIKNQEYDLVYWDNALHHMPSADDAVRWSLEILRPGAWFLMTEFVGANRFQWTEEAVELINAVRNSLNDECFHNPRDPEHPWPRHFRRPTLEEMEYDPSESVDAEAIIPALNNYFPNALIKHVGGTVYHVGLGDILTNIPEGSDILKLCLLLDRATASIPHYAVGIAQKPLRAKKLSAKWFTHMKSQFRRTFLGPKA